MASTYRDLEELKGVVGLAAQEVVDISKEAASGFYDLDDEDEDEDELVRGGGASVDSMDEEVSGSGDSS